MGSMPSQAMNKGKGDRYPIYYVNHDDAINFCRKLTDLGRNSSSLPARLGNVSAWAESGPATRSIMALRATLKRMKNSPAIREHPFDLRLFRLAYCDGHGKAA